MKAMGQAPGRLDVLGGVADYSGSLVLQMPILAKTCVIISKLEKSELRVESSQQEPVQWPLEKWDELSTAPQWARYPLGCLQLFCEAMNWQPKSGLLFEVQSQVPTSMGVSSSAALEVATMHSLEEYSGLRFSGTSLARLAQRVENEIVGAPCGLMDQLASAYGVRGSLLPILCRPDILRQTVALPEGLLVVGWPSGVKHAVTDSPYATARCAAFMGKKILEQYFEKPLRYLTELAPSEVRNVSEALLPTLMSGAEFLEKYGAVDDPHSTVEARRLYPLRAGTLFPIEENFRSEIAVQLLASIHSDNRTEILRAVGELMYQSHAGYSSIGLGCPETDGMVAAIKNCGPEQGFYGARVSGGGSGGTVAVLLEAGELPNLRKMTASLMTAAQSIIL